MCGITFIYSKKNANVLEYIFNSLELIQNRGYDSMGICYLNGDAINSNAIKYEILKNDYVNKIYTLEDLNKLDPTEIQRIYYWGNQQKNQMCQFLKDFLDKEGLLILDEKCGKSQKGEEEEKDKKKEKKKKE